MFLLSAVPELQSKLCKAQSIVDFDAAAASELYLPFLYRVLTLIHLKKRSIQDSVGVPRKMILH